MSVMETVAAKVTGQSAAERSADKLEEAAARVEEWRGRADQLAGEIAAAERDLGAAVLESGDPAAASRALSDLRGDLEAAKAAVGAAEAARVLAEIASLKAQAAEYHKESARLGREADRHESRTTELLAALEEHEQCEYLPSAGRSVTGMPSIRDTGLRTMQLRDEANAALAQAQELERRANDLEETAAASSRCAA